MIKSIRIAIADDNPLRWVSVQSSVAREGRSRIDRPRLLEGDHVFLRWFTDQRARSPDRARIRKAIFVDDSPR